MGIFLQQRNVVLPNDSAPVDHGTIFSRGRLMKALPQRGRGGHLGNTQTEAEKRIRTIRLNVVKVALALRQEPDVGDHRVPMPNVRAEILGDLGRI